MKNQELIIEERIAKAIYLIRDQKIMLDSDLANLYGVETKVLKRAVRRNMNRFPEDFMFELKKEEWKNLRSHFGTSSEWGGTRYPRFVFTEQGVAMLSSVLNSPIAIQVNISIMRICTQMRHGQSITKNWLKRLLNCRKLKLNTTNTLPLFTG